MEMQLLWDYQTADLALSRFEATLKKSKTRNRLISVRNTMVEQQNRVKKLDNTLREAYDDCLRISGEIEKIRQQMASLKKEAENCQDQDIRQIRLVLRAMEDCNKTLNAMYKQVEQIHTMAEGTEATVRDVRGKLVSGKKEFDELKEKHDKELADAAEELERLRAAVKQKEPGIPSNLLEQYKKVKRTRANPVAKVKDNQCSGCNMAIPSLMLSRLRGGEGLVECDSCGRILYYVEQEN
jgi:uncharacterized protein